MTCKPESRYLKKQEQVEHQNRDGFESDNANANDQNAAETQFQSCESKKQNLDDQNKQEIIQNFLKSSRQNNIAANNQNLTKCPRPLCKFVTKSNQYLNLHLRQEHSIYLMNIGVCSAACKYCHLGYVREFDYVKHEESQQVKIPLKKFLSEKQKKLNSQFSHLNCSIESAEK